MKPEAWFAMRRANWSWLRFWLVSENTKSGGLKSPVGNGLPDAQYPWESTRPGVGNTGSLGAAVVPVGGAGAGDLCLGGDIGRGVGGVIGNTGAAGEFTVSADLTAMPQPGGPVTAACGETWYIQGWFRDSDGSGGATSGLTDAIGFTVL